MLKLGIIGENNDGRRDIIIKHLGNQGIVIRHELYESQGMTYEQMQKPEEFGKFLMAFGLLVLQAALSEQEKGKDE
jgi:hypothetical protein